jgi:hypothetical protein
MKRKDFQTALKAAWKAGYQFALNEDNLTLSDDDLPSHLQEDAIYALEDDDKQMRRRDQLERYIRKICVNSDIQQIMTEFVV